MFSLRDTFRHYTGVLRSLKIVYVINNLLNRKRLEHNKELYKKYGVKKSVISNIGYQDLKNKSQDIPWIDQPNAIEAVKAHPEFETFDKATQEQIIHFIENGYMILKGVYDNAQVDELNQDIDRLLNEQSVDFNYRKKIMDAYNQSDIANQYFRNEQLIKLMNFLMGKKVIPFQTINFIEGSEQKAHSDLIHMTTEPQGYLIAAWTALEDCHEGNGPLFYYPKSHRLPFVSCMDYDSGNSKWTIGENSYKQYEKKIAEVLSTNRFEQQYFYAKKGDVLLWHSNLLHGGSAITQKGTTRKSMVSHYYCEDVICYHEITQRPALMK